MAAAPGQGEKPSHKPEEAGGLVMIFAMLQARNPTARAQAGFGVVVWGPYVGGLRERSCHIWGCARMAREFYKKIILGLAAGKVSGIFRRVAAAAGLLGPAAKPEGRPKPQRIL